MKFILIMKEIILVTIFGLFQIIRHIYFILIARIKLVGYYDRIFYLLTILTGIPMLKEWLSYSIVINEQKIDHGIYSDDFLYFLTFLMIAFSTLVITMGFKGKKHQKIREWIPIIRITSLSGLTLLYVLNIFFPERISSSNYAHFTMWFYLFGGFVVSLWTIGILGIKATPRIRLKN
jgi:hypothetical protein